MSWLLILVAAWLAPGLLVGLALLWTAWLGPTLRGERRVSRVRDALPIETSSRRELGGLEPVAAHEVDDGPSAFQQIVGDDTPVAPPPDGLGAHDCAAAAGA